MHTAQVLPFPLCVTGALQSDSHFHAKQSHARQQQPIERLPFNSHHTPHCHHSMDGKQEATQQSQQDVQDPAHHAPQRTCTEDMSLLCIFALCYPRNPTVFVYCVCFLNV